MRIVFFGTPAWALPSLVRLAASEHDIAAVVTAPDARVGRSRRVAPPPVGDEARRRGLPLLQPATLRGRAARREILDREPDALVVVAYGKILPGRLLDAPPHGAVNLHFSLLPRHRGASPVQHTLLAGDERAGVTTMQMDRGLDTGPILLQRETTIAPRENAVQLGERLAGIGADLLAETLPALAAGSIVPRPQDEAGATLAPPLEKAQGLIAWIETATELERRVRAFVAWPPVVCRGPKATLRLRDAEALRDAASRAEPPGTVLGRAGDAVDVACAGGSTLRIHELQPAGARSMSAAAALAGRHLVLGERLGPCVDDG